jgi:hypothetical protein
MLKIQILKSRIAGLVSSFLAACNTPLSSKLGNYGRFEFLSFGF